MSQDTAQEVAVATPEEVLFEAPLSKKQREELNALSLEVYGKRLQWQKMLRKGQAQPGVATTNAGKAISVMRMHHFTVNEIYKTMAQVLKDRDQAVANAKASADAALQATEVKTEETPA